MFANTLVLVVMILLSLVSFFFFKTKKGLVVQKTNSLLVFLAIAGVYGFTSFSDPGFIPLKIMCLTMGAAILGCWLNSKARYVS